MYKTRRTADRCISSEDDLDFKDDPTLLSHIHLQIQMKTVSVATPFVSVGLNIHKRESKILEYNKKNTNQPNLT